MADSAVELARVTVTRTEPTNAMLLYLGKLVDTPPPEAEIAFGSPL